MKKKRLIIIMMFMGSFLGLWSLIQLAIYVLSAFAFYKLAKIRCIENSWMAFIPFLSLYIIGYIGDTLKYNNRTVNSYLSQVPLAYALPLGSLVASVSGVIPLIGGLFGQLIQLAIFLGQILVYFLVFDHYAEANQRVLFTALSIIPVVGPILILYTLRGYKNY